MESILEQLWYGNISPHTNCREDKKETKSLMGYVATHHEHLQSTLTDTQKQVLQKFEDCYAELTDINEREIFLYAFKLGARIAMETMQFRAL